MVGSVIVVESVPVNDIELFIVSVFPFAMVNVAPVAGVVKVYLLNVVPVTFVNAPVLAVVDPIAPGAANVAPAKLLAFRFSTLVVDAITNGAVPGETVDVN